MYKKCLLMLGCLAGTLSAANWTWRALPGFDSEALAMRIYAVTKRYGRVN